MKKNIFSKFQGKYLTTSEFFCFEILTKYTPRKKLDAITLGLEKLIKTRHISSCLGWD